ncbi:hypothetical protein AB4X15_02975 [Peribacillus simplex]|uniref:hypothetical protein n=1 Tax=Peribacillus simplex TaxID=1478 RepID=UPI0034E86A72
MKYILTFGGIDFVEKYDLTNNEVTVSGEMSDAKIFDNKGEADYIADRLACDVRIFC